MVCFAVVHIRMITSTIDKYQVYVIRSYKNSSEISTVGSVWIPIDSCRCPFLVPGKEYLLMGQMTMVGSTRVGVKVRLRRDSFIEEWKGSLLRKLRAAKHRCRQEPTMRPTSVATTPTISIEGIGEFFFVQEKAIYSFRSTLLTVSPSIIACIHNLMRSWMTVLCKSDNSSY